MNVPRAKAVQPQSMVTFSKNSISIVTSFGARGGKGAIQTKARTSGIQTNK